MEKKNNRTLKKMFGVIQAEFFKIFGPGIIVPRWTGLNNSGLRQVKCSLVMKDVFWKGTDLQPFYTILSKALFAISTKQGSTDFTAGFISLETSFGSAAAILNKIKVLENCEMHSSNEIARRKQIVQDFHELKTEIMELLGMNPVQIEMLDTQSIIQGTEFCL